MPVDTQEKRMAAVGVGRPFMRATFPIATPDVEWRASIGLTYGANGLQAPVTPTGITDEFQGFIANVGRMMR